MLAVFWCLSLFIHLIFSGLSMAAFSGSLSHPNCLQKSSRAPGPLCFEFFVSFFAFQEVSVVNASSLRKSSMDRKRQADDTTDETDQEQPKIRVGRPVRTSSLMPENRTLGCTGCTVESHCHIEGQIGARCSAGETDGRRGTERHVRKTSLLH